MDIVQSLKDLSFQQSSGSNMVPEISDLESRMTDLGTQLVNLPGKMAEGLRKELEELNTYKVRCKEYPVVFSCAGNI